MTWPVPAHPASCGWRGNSTSGAAFTRRWSWNGEKRAGRRPPRCNCPDFRSENRLLVGVFRRLYSQKLAGIIPRPANRPPFWIRAWSDTDMPTKRAAAKPAKPKRAEKPKLTAKKPATKPVAAKTAAKPAATKTPAAARSEERRVGKECRSRGGPYH